MKLKNLLVKIFMWLVMKKKYLYVEIIAFFFPMLMAMQSYAQLKGDHLLGDFGLGAGTQAPPTVIGALPLYWYGASYLKNSDGDVAVDNLNIDAFLLGVGGSVVTNAKILNANYGFSLLFAFMSNRLEGNKINSTTDLAFSDMYIQPLQLGWHAKKADYTVGYGIYLPTGKFEFGGNNNTGMGMWTHEFSAGTTLFFDQQKTFHFATIGFFETHSDKKETNVRVGNIISLEGGIGKTFYKPIAGFPIPIVFNAGPVYYMQFKVSGDKIPIGNNIFTGDKDQIYSWGLEFNVLHPKIRTSLGFRWLDEFGAKNRFEGNTFLITVGYIIKSLSREEEKNK
jgi:hypothetical protein